jgi:hypothetical protein
MKHLLLPLWLLVCGASVALAALPCSTRDEAVAEAVFGYFLVQRIAAERCDESLGGNAFRTLHGHLTAKYEQQLAAALAARHAYFVRAHGDKAESELNNVKALMTDLLSAQLVATETTCAHIRGEFEKRLADGWAPILDRLTRRVDGVPPESANRCKE